MEISTLISLVMPISIGGICSGIIAGLFGVGGGIILVPSIVFTLEFLDYNQNITMHIAVATSLALIIPTAISSSWGHYKKRVVDFLIIKRLFIALVIGSIFGAIYAQRISGDGLRLLFGVIAIFSSINMMRKHQFILGKEMPKSYSLNAMIGSVIGAFSAMVGIGGGALSIPLMNTFSIGQHKATGTASAIGLIIAIPSTAVYLFSDINDLVFPEWTVGMVYLPVFVVFVPLTILGAQIGVALAHRINGLILRRIFSIFLLIMALRMIYVAFQ